MPPVPYLPSGHAPPPLTAATPAPDRPPNPLPCMVPVSGQRGVLESEPPGSPSQHLGIAAHPPCLPPLTPSHLSPGGPEFLRTPLGGSFLVYESFLYRREKAAGEKVYWTCRDQARMGCRSRAITQGRQVTVMRGHCHPPDLGGLEALRQREKRPGTAQRGSTGWSDRWGGGWGQPRWTGRRPRLSTVPS